MEIQEDVIDFVDKVAFYINTSSLCGYTTALGFYLINMQDISRGIKNITGLSMLAGTLITVAGISLRLRFHIQEVMKGGMTSLPPE